MHDERIDYFFDKQPEPKFIEWLNSPLHERAPENFGSGEAREGEISALGAYIAECHEPWRELILTATEDFERFLGVSGVFGSRYPIKILFAEGYSEESFKISVEDECCTVYASDSEGARRAVYYLEEEMIKREGAILPLGDILRTSHIRRRITRGFFSPTNRPPKYGDELFDDVDYYPENYLSRLAHNGTNGLWIYTSFAQLIKSPLVPSKTKGCERRMEKLRSVVERCKKYGIKVYLFAIEPLGLLEEDHAPCEDMLGPELPKGITSDRRPFCPRIPKTQEHVIYCIENIFRKIPGLAGYITIPAGERPTTCPSLGTYKSCPRCGKYSRGENLAYSVDMIREGIRRAGTGAEFISWTYGHRYWDDEDIVDYIENTPSDIVIMQNFEDRGIDTQLGKPRIAWDYWLSYPGPSDMFSLSARAAKRTGNPMYAKMQVCSSHEIATVPYIPAPGILFDKYKAASELGVSGIMECWYFGNYPSLMNRASTELCYLDDYSDKDAFLLELAARLYGRSRAERIAAAWRAFEEGYRSYPTNIMFSYYGPMHDGVVWELAPIPKNLPLPRSWLLLDPPDGDRIGECLFKGHTLEEAITLAERMCSAWERGLALLPLSGSDEARSCAEAIGLLFASGRNILKFYKLREQLGSEKCSEPWSAVTEMEGIAALEAENSRRMIEICERDPRIGYHSEAEGYKFFPEKLRARIDKLDSLFDTDFKEIRERLLEGRHPLGAYFAEGEDAYMLGVSSADFEWVPLDSERAFGAYIEGDELKIPIICPRDDEFSVNIEFALFRPESTVVYSPKAGAIGISEVSAPIKPGLRLGRSVLSHQSVFGDGIEAELANFALETSADGERRRHLLSVKIPSDKWNRYSAIRLKIEIGGVAWKTDPHPTETLGKLDISPNAYGYLLPKTT